MANLEKDAKEQGIKKMQQQQKEEQEKEEEEEQDEGDRKTRKKFSSKKGIRDDIEEADDQESYYKWLEENPNAGRGEGPGMGWGWGGVGRLLAPFFFKDKFKDLKVLRVYVFNLLSPLAANCNVSSKTQELFHFWGPKCCEPSWLFLDRSFIYYYLLCTDGDDDDLNVEYDADGNPIAPPPGSRHIDPLPAINHNEVDYDAFERAFYTEHPDIATLSNIQVGKGRPI